MSYEIKYTGKTHTFVLSAEVSTLEEVNQFCAELKQACRDLVDGFYCGLGACDLKRTHERQYAPKEATVEYRCGE